MSLCPRASFIVLSLLLPATLNATSPKRQFLVVLLPRDGFPRSAGCQRRTSRGICDTLGACVFECLPSSMLLLHPSLLTCFPISFASLFLPGLVAFRVMLYDDEDHGLFLTPKICTYSATKGGASRHMIVNGTAERLVVKVKCSNNLLYRVNPVHTFLDPGSSQRLQVVRDPGPAQKDKLVLLYKPAIGLHSNARDDFEASPGEAKRTLVVLVAGDKGDSEAASDGLPPPLPKSAPPGGPHGRLFNVHQSLNRLSMSQH